MKRSGQVVAPIVLVLAAGVAGLYLLGVQVHKGIAKVSKQTACIVTTLHKCPPKPKLQPWKKQK